MSYLIDVLMWLVAGAAAGVALGEGIGQIRRVAARNSAHRQRR